MRVSGSRGYPKPSSFVPTGADDEGGWSLLLPITLIAGPSGSGLEELGELEPAFLAERRDDYRDVHSLRRWAKVRRPVFMRKAWAA